MRDGGVAKIVAGTVEGSLRKRIAAGEWAASGRLPAERELAAQYGVARNTLRRAVEAIANDGTIERHVGRGTFVNGEAAELARHCTACHGRFIRPISMAARLSSTRKRPRSPRRMRVSSDLLAIGEAHQRATDAHQTDDFEHWDTQFHHRIFAATRNELLASVHHILQVIRSRKSVDRAQAQDIFGKSPTRLLRATRGCRRGASQP